MEGRDWHHSLITMQLQQMKHKEGWMWGPLKPEITPITTPKVTRKYECVSSQDGDGTKHSSIASEPTVGW